MAFIDQVQDLTSLSASDTDELSQFLKDGVIDVTNRWLAMRPQDIELFGRETSEQTSNGSLNLNGARIISVIREDGVTSNNWRACRKISSSQQYLVTDEESLSFASKFNPAYMIGDAGKISVFPAPGADPNAFKAYYVNKDPVNSSGSALIHSHDDILYFPIDKVYLVVMYAGIRSLHAAMGATTITDLTVTAVPPDVPTLSSITFSSIDSAVDATLVAAATSTTLGGSSTAPSYSSPTTTISGVAWATEYPATEVDIATALAAIVTNVDLANAIITASPVPPETITDTIAAFSLSGEFDDALLNAKNLIDNNIPASGSDAFDLLLDEDTELVGATLQTASQELQRANTALQGSLQTFNTDMQKFQASGLGKFSAEVQEYQAEVGEMSARAQGYIQTAQGYASEVKTRLSATQTKIGEYQARLQDALNEFNDDNAAFQAGIQEALAEFQSANQIAISNAERSQNRQLQNSINDMKAIFDNNAELIQKFGAEIQEYQAEVGTQVQEYTQNLQADGMGYQWLQGQYAALKTEYDAAFMIAAPKQQPQQQARR